VGRQTSSSPAYWTGEDASTVTIEHQIVGSKYSGQHGKTYEIEPTKMFPVAKNNHQKCGQQTLSDLRGLQSKAEKGGKSDSFQSLQGPPLFSYISWL
jgi:hypothetical protein